MPDVLMFNPGAIRTSQRALGDVAVDVNAEIEQPLRCVALPEMPAATYGEVTALLRGAVAAMTDARAGVAAVSRALATKAESMEATDTFRLLAYVTENLNNFSVLNTGRKVAGLPGQLGRYRSVVNTQLARGAAWRKFDGTKGFGAWSKAVTTDKSAAAALEKFTGTGRNVWVAKHLGDGWGSAVGKGLGRANLAYTVFSGAKDVYTGSDGPGWHSKTTRVVGGAGAIGGGALLAGSAGLVVLAPPVAIVAGGAVVVYGAWSLGNAAYDNRKQIGRFVTKAVMNDPLVRASIIAGHEGKKAAKAVGRAADEAYQDTKAAVSNAKEDAGKAAKATKDWAEDKGDDVKDKASDIKDGAKDWAGDKLSGVGDLGGSALRKIPRPSFGF